MKTSNKQFITGEIPSNWKVEKLGEYGECIRGVSYKPNDLVDNSQKGVIILRSNNINNQRINFKELKYVLAKNVSDRQVLRDKDIVICMSNGSKRLVGKAARYISMGEENTVSFGAFCSAFRVYDYQQADFIFQLFQSDSYQRQIDLALAGSAINNLKDSSINNLSFAFPSQSEQLKIAKILSTVDEKIEIIGEQIAQTQQLKKGLMQGLLTKGIGHTKFKPSHLGEIPESWEILKFGKLIINHGYGPRFNAKDYSNQGNVKTIRGTDIQLNGEISYNQVPLAKLDKETVNNHKLKDGDLVMITTADCGLTGVFYEQDLPFIPSAYAVRISLCPEAYPEYFKYVMQTELAKNQVKKFIRKGTVANLPGSDILKFEFPVPPLHEQEKIAKALLTVDEKLEVLQEKKSQYQELKKGLMQQLLTGKLRVNYLVEEPELA